MDVEPLYYMLSGQFPLHRFFHTYVGATLVIAASIFLFLGAQRIARPLSLPNLFHWQDLGIRPIAIGATLGAYSHIVLDSVMHSDIRPLAPFSDANPLLRLVPLGMLHGFCILAGIVGVAVSGIRRLFRSGH
jgi:membrane-bound metal-dependent hydrolase YbcI (DUF457 family)